MIVLIEYGAAAAVITQTNEKLKAAVVDFSPCVRTLATDERRNPLRSHTHIPGAKESAGEKGWRVPHPHHPTAQQ
jgi:hypothetical protein